MAAIFITLSCHWSPLAGQSDAIRHQELVDLLELGSEQTIERTVEVDMSAFSLTPLSHARAQQ
jgi:hypothetical protein